MDRTMLLNAIITTYLTIIDHIALPTKFNYQAMSVG